MIHRYTCPILFGLLILAPAFANAQTANQQFKVAVPGRMAIAAATPIVSHSHDESDNDQTMPEQWTVKGNKRNGVTVTFSTGSAFVNTSDTDYKNDATLTLAPPLSTIGPATWTVNTSTDFTNHGGGKNVATVQASSNKAGMATFELSCTCMVGSFWEMAEGSYEMTVTGTVTAN